MNLALTLVLNATSTTEIRHVCRMADSPWATTESSLMGNVDKMAWSETDDTGWATER